MRVWSGLVALAVAVGGGMAIGAAATHPLWIAPPAPGLADLSALVQAHPDSSSVRLRALDAQLRTEDRAGALRSLGWLKAHGHVFSTASRQRLMEVLTKWGAWNEGLLAPPADVQQASSELASVPAEALLVEGALRDARTGRLFVSTVVSRLLWVREPEGRWFSLKIAGADSLSGMALDPEQRLLWVASSDLGRGEGPADPFHGLIGLDLDSLATRRHLVAPPGVNPSDIAIGRNGRLYASDPLRGGIYQAGSDGFALTEIVEPGLFRSPQGLAESADAELLYVSDYRYGLAAISLRSGAVLRVGGADRLAVPLDGIDGLWRLGNSLVAVQNGASPMRILKLRLGRDRVSVVGAEVLEQAHPDWTEPTSGSLDGDSLIYVATGQWDRFDQGKPAADRPPLATQVRILPIRTTKH